MFDRQACHAACSSGAKAQFANQDRSVEALQHPEESFRLPLKVKEL
jgi:hypothetical protein